MPISPLNSSDFTAQREFTEYASDQFADKGAVWLQSAIPRQQIDEFQAAFSERYLSLSFGELKRRHALVGDYRFMVTVSIKQPFSSTDLLDNFLVTPILEKLLGGDFVISSFGAVVAYPGADEQPIHFDGPPLFAAEATCNQLPPYAITMVVPLVDLDETTGTTAIWPGSHHEPGSREKLRKLQDKSEYSQADLPYAKRGDIYFMDYRVIHGGTANRSKKPRRFCMLFFVDHGFATRATSMTSRLSSWIPLHSTDCRQF